MHYPHDRIFWGQLLAVFMTLIINMMQPAWIGRALSMEATSCADSGNSRLCVITIMSLAGVSITPTKNGQQWSQWSPSTSQSCLGWSQTRMRITKKSFWQWVRWRLQEGILLAHHQLLAYHCWLSLCPWEAAFLKQLKVSKPLRLCLDYDKSI